MSVLVCYKLLDEDTLVELIQIDKKQFRAAIATLRNDKLVKQRVVKEKNAETGAICSYSFYYVNYYLFVNVVRYKLDRVRRNLVTEEKTGTNRASFNCNNCRKNFDDLEISRLLDLSTGKMTCYHCGDEVVENAQEKKENTGKSILAKYNEQFEPIFRMVEKCIEVELAPELLDPEPTENQIQQACYARNNQGSAAAVIRNERRLNMKQEESSFSKYFDQSITIRIGDEDTRKPSSSAKLQPAWLLDSATSVSGGQQPQTLTTSFCLQAGGGKADSAGPAPPPTQGGNHNSAILEDLLMFENHDGPSERLSSSELSSDPGQIDLLLPEDACGDPDKYSSSPPPSLLNPTTSFSCLTDHPHHLGSGTRSADEVTATAAVVSEKVKIGSEAYDIDEITTEMLEKMTPMEHDEYIRVLNEVYKNSF